MGGTGSGHSAIVVEDSWSSHRIEIGIENGIEIDHVDIEVAILVGVGPQDLGEATKEPASEGRLILKNDCGGRLRSPSETVEVGEESPKPGTLGPTRRSEGVEALHFEFFLSKAFGQHPDRQGFHLALPDPRN